MLDEGLRESRNLVALYAKRLQLRQEGSGSRPLPRRAKTPVVREFGRQSAARSQRLPNTSSPPSVPPPGAGDNHAPSPA
ncbi:MAG TPA: hypothetical protein VFS96_05590 [Nitrolancea sp.]|nr:hypothetical protein [Nitrolancea sp.]